MQALVTFVRVDMAFRMNGLNHAFIGASQARVAALLVALQPIERPHAGGDGQRRTQRTQIPAVKSFDKQSDSKQDNHKQNKRPGAIKLQDDCSLERFHLCKALRQLKRIQRKAKKSQINHILDRP